jgi:predicted naringenin-chalcone synthase
MYGHTGIDTRYLSLGRQLVADVIEGTRHSQSVFLPTGHPVANALFGDAAAALVGIHRRNSPPDAWRVAASGSCVFPDSADAMSWTVGDHGFEMTLAKRVPDLIATHLRPWLEGWLKEHELSLDRIGSWAVHPGGPKILSAIGESLALPADALATSRAILAEYGNVSSPTVLFLLDRLQTQGASRPCVAWLSGPA